MELTTLTLAFSVPLLLTAVALLVRQKKVQATRNIVEARKRAQQRADEHAYADTEPVNDPYRSSLDFHTGVTIEDEFNHSGLPLSQDQINTIGLIFEGYRPPVMKELAKPGGPTLAHKSGVPLNLMAFDDQNTIPKADVEYLDPEFTWPDKYTD